jgi:hypothetical protein
MLAVEVMTVVELEEVRDVWKRMPGRYSFNDTVMALALGHADSALAREAGMRGRGIRSPR